MGLISSLFFLTLGLSLGYVLIARPVYNVFFHRLRKFPGPLLWGATQIPSQLSSLSGNGHRRILQLHQKYGDVVRVGPNQLSYHHPDAWKEVMGHRKAGAGEENGKEPIFYESNKHSIIGADTESHGRYRRLLSNGFSAKSMAEQEPLIRQYVDLLIERLHEKAAGGTRLLDIVSWFNFTTFDIIGDLTFSEPFGCLNTSGYHPWVALIFASVYLGMVIGILSRHVSNLDKMVTLFFPSAIEKRTNHRQLVASQVAKRLAQTTPRPDFMQSMVDPKGRVQLNKTELHQTANVLIIAGSETTATVLSGTTFYLGTNPKVLAELTAEVRDSFTREDEINLLSVQRLKYMHAVLQESMRMCPPVPAALPRITPPSGNVIFGEYVPRGTILEVWQWPLYHDPKHFALPEEFHPERWLGDDPRFVNDQKEAFQPFSYGSRNCLGKNLAYAEMRLILARLIWNFEIQLDRSSLDWEKNLRVYTLLEKGAVNVRLTPRDIHQTRTGQTGWG